MDIMELKHAAEQIEMPEDMQRRMIERVDMYQPSHAHRKRGPLILIAAAVCAILTIPILAATSESAYQLLYQLSPATAQLFQPICRSDEDQGIRMDVISARVKGNAIEVYIAFQDLEGNRVDETIDLYDSYAIQRPFDSSAHCELAGYDQETGTAYFLVTITEYDDQNVIGDKVTFSVREFLSHKRYYEGIEIPVNWSAVSTTTELWEDAEIVGFGGLEKVEDAEQSLLMPSENAFSETVIEGIDFTGIGFVDGKLHIQYAVKDRSQNDNHGYFYLIDQTGKQIHSTYSISAIKSSSDTRTDYQEQVFDVSADQVGEYRLMGDFVIADQMIQGNWRVTFPIEQDS